MIKGAKHSKPVLDALHDILAVLGVTNLNLVQMTCHLEGIWGEIIVILDLFSPTLVYNTVFMDKIYTILNNILVKSAIY